LILTAVNPLRHLGLRVVDEGGIVDAVRPGVDPGPLADRTAEQFVDRYAVMTALDVPQSLVDAGQGARQHRSATVEAALGDGLPVLLDP